MSRLILAVLVLGMGFNSFAINIQSCKNAKQIRYLRADLETALAQKLIATDELKTLKQAKSCDAYQFAAEELLKLAAERAGNQSENIAEQEP